MSGQAFKVRLVGTGYANGSGPSRPELLARCRRGEAVELRREPENPHDPFAVAVHAAGGGRLGYVPRGDRRLADHLDGGLAVEARIAHLSDGRSLLDRLLGRQGRGVRCVIRIEKRAGRAEPPAG
jgi:hypothetical protein